MCALFLSMLLTQSPATPDNAYQQFLEEHLLAIASADGITAVKTPQRTFKLSDDDFSKAFALTPDLAGLANDVRSLAQLTGTLTVVTFVPLGLALLSSVLSIAIRSAVFPLLITAVGLLLVATVLLVINVVKGNELTLKFYELVERHNRELLTQRPAGTGVTSPFAPAL